MVDHNNPTSDSPYGQPEAGAATAARRKLSEKAEEVKEKVADFGRNTLDNLDGSRKSISDAAHTAADQITDVAHSAAHKLHDAADYIRDTDWKAMGEDVKDIVKRYPGPSLAAAAVLGFIVARSFRRD
jgi:hypothetical protein